MFSEFLDTCRARYGSGDSNTSIGEWICANTTLNKRPFTFNDYPFQRQIADDLHPNLNVEKCSQVGLALALNTPVPTPTGWTTMGEVQVGDLLFDAQGRPTPVTYVSPTWLDRDCYEIVFDTGETIVADGAHRWPVEADRSFDLSGLSHKGRPRKGAAMFKSGVLDTATIFKFHALPGRNRFAIPNAAPLFGAEQDLPLDAYFLGYWLGDGNSRASVLTVHADDAPHLVEELGRRGFDCSLSSEKGAVLQVGVKIPRDLDLCPRGHSKSQVGTLQPHGACAECSKQNRKFYCDGATREVSVPYDTTHARLTALGVMGKGAKSIPPQYLRAPVQVRLDLLRGLLDSDGSVTKKGRISFYNTNTALVEGVVELVHSLGYKARVRWRMNPPSTMKSGHVITPRLPIAEVSFSAYADQPVFLLPRKRSRLLTREMGRPSEALRRRIVSVKRVESVPTRCLTVDNDEHLFLVGKGMIPTHNTEVQIRKFFAMLTRNTAVSGIFTLPNTDMFKRIYSGRMSPILQSDAIFNPPTEFKPVRRNDLIQIRDSFGYITGCSEGDATSISADFLFHDEYDLSPQDIIGLFPSRLQNSDMRIIQSFSTPSYLGVKINRALASSDRHEYLVKCDSCGHHQVPEFTHRFIVIPNLPDVEALTDLTVTDIAEIDLDACYVKCERCSRRLDLSRADNREWVPMYPDRRHNRGYKVRPFSTGRLTPGYILDRLAKAKEKENIRGFFNTVLGDPFASSTNQLQRGDVEAVMAPTGNIPDVSRDRPCYLGIDVGLTCHIVLITPSNSTVGYDFVFWDTCHASQLEERVTMLRSKYSIIQGLIDRFPYTPTADALRELTGGIIMPTQYRGGSIIQRVRDENGDVTHYSINRTYALDRVKTAVTEKLSVIAGYGPHRETIITHFGDMIREDRAEQEPEWIKTAGNDHYFHAAALALLAPRVNEDVYSSRSASSATTLIVQSSNWMQNTSNLGPRSPAQVAAARGGLL